MNSSARFIWCTPTGPGADAGAISIVQIVAVTGAELDAALVRLGVPPVAVGASRLCSLPGGDSGLVIRWTAEMAQFTGHAGVECIRRLDAGLKAAGLVTLDAAHVDPREVYPEACDLSEACAMAVLSHAASPLAIDVVLRQVEVWRKAAAPIASEVEARRLDRLLHPPLVAAVGPPNIGKSTLVNALAGRSVAVVADEPGTTRDHVGVSLELDGLLVRWIDMPGWRGAAAEPEEAEALRIALPLIRGADLILSCADTGSDFVEPAELGIGAGAPIMRVALRADLGLRSGAEVNVSSLDQPSIIVLAGQVRARLVSDELLRAGVRWAFHPALKA